MTSLLTQTDVCCELRISRKKLQLLRRARKIEYLQIGHRTIRFTQAAVEKFIRENQR